MRFGKTSLRLLRSSRRRIRTGTVSTRTANIYTAHIYTAAICTAAICIATICGVGLTGCTHHDDAPSSSTNAATKNIPDSVNITCEHFNALKPEEQKKAADTLLNSYNSAGKLASDQAQSHQDFHLEGKLSASSQTESPSFLNLARHTCALPDNKSVRLLTVMGFN